MGADPIAYKRNASISLIVAAGFLGLTSCQSPALGIGVPIENGPPQQGVRIPGLPAAEEDYP